MPEALVSCIVGDNIVSSLGFSSDDNYRLVCSGATGLRYRENVFGLPLSAMVSLIDYHALVEKYEDMLHESAEGYTLPELSALYSAASAIGVAGIDAAHPKTVFVLSSTKGNVALLEEEHGLEDERLHLWYMARMIARHFDNVNTPVVVSNACISGAHALLVAKRLLASGCYDRAIIVGVDQLSRFILSGFHSFKALSSALCKPFDADRCGLNLGEAAATVILERKALKNLSSDDTVLIDGAVCNDANHISGPSRTGEGLFLALHRILQGRDPSRIAFVNAHGTATPYNDEMESIALHRAGIDAVPVNALKGYFGHTLGAAGVLEVIISARALHDGRVIKTAGFAKQGTTWPVPVTATEQTTDKPCFVKMLSGFGGCNAALLFGKGGTCI